mmetsp:Transcript_3616/g.7722  ORF Transcript_3616/g.7722 Transcript_3616/m.7722 type:complete len:260 (-) Transcript_3616:649-1428(-)
MLSWLLAASLSFSHLTFDGIARMLLKSLAVSGIAWTVIVDCVPEQLSTCVCESSASVSHASSAASSSCSSLIPSRGIREVFGKVPKRPLMSCISDNLEGAEDVRWRVFDGLRWIRIKKQPSVVTTAKTVRAMPKCKCGSKLSREGSGGGVDGDDFAGDDTASHENGDDGEKCDALGVATASGSVDGVYCSPHPSTFAGRIRKRHSSATRHGSAKVSVHTASELHSTCSVPSLWSACQITAPLPSPGVGCFCWPLIGWSS